MFSRWLSLPVGLAAWCLSTAAWAVTPATLVTPDLDAQPVTVLALGDGVISFFDADRELVRAPISQYVQIRDIGDAPEPGEISETVLTLSDGQRFAGKWVGVDAKLQTISWEHPLLGRFDAPLDDVSTVTRSGAPLGDQGLGEDDLRLANGDRLSGYVASIEDDRLIVELAGADTAVPLEAASIDALRLANPPAEESAGWFRLLLADGSQLKVRSPSVSSDILSFDAALPGQPIQPHQIELADASRLDFAAAGTRLIDLAGQPMEVAASSEPFGLPTPPRVRAGIIDLTAPVTVVFDLPQGVSRFAATAELLVEPELAEVMRTWSDFDLIVTVGDNDPVRFHISGRRPSAAINLPATASSLTLEVDPAVNGPVLDRLRLRDPVLLQQTTASATSGDADP